MASVSVQCPGCLAKLNLSDSSKLGKKIKCPKCSDIFVAEASDDEDMDDVEDEDKPKSGGGRKRAGAGGGKKGGGAKKKSAGGGGNTGAIVGGAVAVVALIGAGLYFGGVFGGNAQPLPAPPAADVQPMAAQAPPIAPVAATPVAPAITPAERTLALRWMPADTEVLLHVKVAALWQAPLLKELVDSPQVAFGILAMQQATGLTPSDIESVTVGLADLQKMQSLQMSMGMPSAQSLPKALIVVRTKKSITLDEILKVSQEIKAAEHNSKKYFESVNSPEAIGGWVAEPTTLVFAALPELKGAMDRGETVIPRKELAFMDAAAHVLVIAAPKDPKGASADMPALPGMPPELAEVLKTLKESMTAIGLGVSIRGGFDLQTSMVLSNAEGAAKVKTGLDAWILEGKKQFEALKFIVPPPMSELGDQLLNNLKVDVQSQTVKVVTSIPDSDQPKLQQAMAMAMAMAMGMGPGMSGPGAPPGSSIGGLPDSASQNIGEAEPVAAELAAGIPSGTTLTASTSWHRVPPLSADGKETLPLQLMLDLQGDAISTICGFGQINIKTGSLNGGGTLRVSKATPNGEPSPTKALIPFQAENTDKHPEGTMRFAVVVDPPAAKDTMITSLEGTFKILTFDDAEEFTIEDAPKTAKRPLSDPALKAAGVKLVGSKTDAGETFTLSCAKGFFLGSATSIDPGAVEVAFNPDVEKNQPVLKLLSPPGGKFPDALQVKFKLFRGVKEQAVTFKFANVQLPSANSEANPPVAGPPGGTPPQLPKSPFDNARNAAKASIKNNNLKQIALAFHNYHDVNGGFPGAGRSAAGKAGLSWRVHLLPYLDQADLYKQFNLDEPWDSERNKALIEKMPKLFKSDEVKEAGKTSVHVFTGTGAPFAGDQAPKIRSITDGTSNTILAVEAGPDTAAIWTKPGGLDFDPKNPLASLGQLSEDVFRIVMCDGSVRTIPKTVMPDTLRKLIQSADGEPVQF